MLAILVLLLFGSVTQNCLAQFNSSVGGTVTDQTGALVPGAEVTLHSVQTNIDRRDTTEATGYFRFNGVGPGDYQVIVAANGFAKKVTGVHVTQDEAANVNVALALTGATTNVTVTGQADQLDADETRVQTTLQSEQLAALPLQNGSPLEAVRTGQGVTGVDEDRALSPVSINGNTMNAQANGRSNAGSTYQLDGVSIQDNTGYASGVNHNLTFTPSEDMVQEVAVEVTSYSVDFGSASSMKVNFTSKGGTNQFHGTFGDRYSGRGLNATADFASPALPNSRRWYSTSLGGPIWKDKTFFFFSYLHQAQVSTDSNLQHWATNDFTGTWAPQNYPNSTNVKNLLAAFPVGNATGGQNASVIKQGVTAHASDLFATSNPGVCAVPIKNAPFYLGSQIGSTPIDCGMEVVDYGVLNQAPVVNGFQIDGRIDQYLRGGKERFYGAYVLEPQQSDFIWWRPGFNSHTPGGSRYANFNYTHLFSPNLISQAAVSYVRFYNSFTSNPANVIPFLSLMIGGGDDATDFFGTPGDPAWQKAHNLQFHEDVTWTHGRHNVKGGFSLARLGQYGQNAGWSSKAEDPLYFGWSDMLDDHPWSYSLATLSGATGQFLANIQGSVVTQLGLYGEDDWKVKPNLLLTLGLRWDSYGNPEPWGADALPYYNMVVPSGATLRDSIVAGNVSTARVSKAFAGAQDVNFMPRVGFAWTPTFKQKMTVHGGVGIYEDAMDVGGVVSGLSINSPSYLNLSFGATNPAPLNIVDPRNFYGTDWTKPAPFGNTYSYPSITPTGVDKSGEVTLDLGGVTTVLTSALSAVDPHLKPQKTSLYSLQIETELPHNLIVGTGYSGSYSWGQYASGDYNSFPGDKIINNGTLKRLSPEWLGISKNANLLTNNYNSLLVTVRQSYSRLNWHATYTWSKTLGNGGSIADIYDPKHYYGPASGSVPHSFNGSIAYEFPGRDLHNSYQRALLGGWEVSGVGTAQSGSPFSLETTAAFVPIANALPSEGGTGTTDISNPSSAGEYLANGQANNLVTIPAGIKTKGFNRSQWKYGIFSQYGYTYNSIPTIPSGSTAAQSGQAFLNPTGYGINPVYSNQGYNSFVGPGYLGLDAALHKKVYLPWFGNEGRSTLTMGLEGSNIINRVNLTGPASADLNTVSTFGLGVAQAARQARILQVMGKFQF